MTAVLRQFVIPKPREVPSGPEREFQNLTLPPPSSRGVKVGLQSFPVRFQKHSPKMPMEAQLENRPFNRSLLYGDVTSVVLDNFLNHG